MTFETFAGTIMWENEPQVSFSLEKGQVVSCRILDGNHIPYEFHECKNQKRAVLFFLEDRVVPSTRIGIDRDLQRVGIPYYDPTVLLKYNHGYSVSDRYWIRFSGENMTYEDLENRVMEQVRKRRQQ